MIDYGELKRLAEAVPDWCVAPTAYEEDRRYSDGEVALLSFLEKATPAAVLALIAENEALLEALEGMMQVYGGIKWDTGAVEIELQNLARAAIANARKTAAK